VQGSVRKWVSCWQVVAVQGRSTYPRYPADNGNEVATNSVRYGGGFGNLRLWRNADDVVCEVSDEGRIHDPLVGRERPPTDRDGGAGLYLAHHFCDLVQLRSTEGGTVIRLHMRRP